MKKTIIAIFVATIFASCGGSSEPVTTDSTTVDSASVDSSLTASDTGTAHIPGRENIK